MGKPTGFMEYKREVSKAQDPKERIRHFNEFHEHLPMEEQQLQGARCMECGVPFCQAGMMICGMASGCPLHNLVPEWNDLVYNGNWQQAYNRLKKTNSFPEFTSRVCPALCEAACTCGLNGEPVATRENEYAIIENIIFAFCKRSPGLKLDILFRQIFASLLLLIPGVCLQLINHRLDLIMKD